LAEKIGAGPWRAASAQGGQLTLALPENVHDYGIAYYCPAPSGPLSANEEFVFEATVQDNITSVAGCLSPSTITKGSVTGTVDASAVTGVAQVQIYAPLAREVLGTASGSFSLEAQQGVDDVAFTAVDASGNILAVKIVRSQTVPGVVNNGNGVTFSTADMTTSNTISVTNVPPGFVPLIPTGAVYRTSSETDLMVSNSGQYAVVPSSEAQSGDSYQFHSNYYSGSNSVVTSSLTTNSANAVSLALPIPLPYSAPTPAAFPSFSFNYSGVEGIREYFASLLCFANNSVESVTSIFATVAYKTGLTSLAVPDLSNISGFPQPASSGTSVSWSASVTGGTYGAPGQPVGTGSEWLATNFGIYTEP
jgi:hypothetical protein